ncbi:MAG TPA: transposase [Paludibacteraceae bacterium]|nr:transposase [Paludibacteraceae bacterium]
MQKCLLKCVEVRKKVQLFMSDALKGIEESKTQYFSQSELQFCVVHLECNLLSSVKPAHKKEVCEDLKEVF